jgi:hypothetical protein
MCFVAGVWLACSSIPAVRNHPAADGRQFWLFCLVGGWFFIYGLSFLRDIPTVGAAVDKGGAIWMLGVMLALRASLGRSDLKSTGIWLTALIVYPVLTLLLWGFLGYGTVAVIIVISALAISTRSRTKVLISSIIAVFLGLTIFVNYFASRDRIRDAVWGGRHLEERINVVLKGVEEFEWFDPSNESHLIALDQRLNQNYFAGLAAVRIDEGHVDYLYGRSVWEALQALVPRALWPDKPVFGGSGDIVADMTGLQLSKTTSWGVGNVMEFQINFGIPGLVIGFFGLGWLIGTLDRKAAVAQAHGDLDRLIIFFLPGVALIQPNGSMVELVGGGGAALVASYGWKWAWKHWTKPRGYASKPRARKAVTTP